jgi:metal-responsive CopG/Arc/MetJ family transcriptional regulator
MFTLDQLEKQQVGLRLPKYLIDEIDTLTKEYSLNRSDIITESIKAFISEQKSKKFYDDFEKSCNEVNAIQKGELKESTLQELIDEL